MARRFSTALLLILVGCSRSGPVVTFTMQGNSGDCDVSGIELTCTAVPRYLIDKLQLSPGTRVTVGVTGREDSAAIAAVLGSLKAVGFESVSTVEVKAPAR